MPLWHAINHGMTGLSTGGFAVTDSSIAAYESLPIRLALLPIMFVRAIPLPVYYLLLEGKGDTNYWHLEPVLTFSGSESNPPPD